MGSYIFYAQRKIKQARYLQVIEVTLSHTVIIKKLAYQKQNANLLSK